jgi:hypothetical protein
MTNIYVLLVLLLVPGSIAAQQEDVDICSKARAFTPEVKQCLDVQNQKRKADEAKAAEEMKVLKAAEAANDLKRAADNVGKMRSTNQGDQIDGVTGTARDLNSKGNSNPVSKKITDQSISIIDQFDHAAIERLNKANETVKSSLEPNRSSSSSFASQPHQLNESTRGNEPHQTSVEQQFQNQATLLAAPSARAPQVRTQTAETINETHESTLQEQFQSQQATLLSSAASVNAVGKAERAVDAREGQRIAIETRKNAAYWAEIAERSREQDRRNRQQAEADRIAQRKKEKAEEAAEAREEARELRAWMAAMGLTPVQTVPAYVPSYIPSFVPGTSSSVPSSNSYDFSSTFSTSSIPAGDQGLGNGSPNGAPGSGKGCATSPTAKICR